MKFSYGPETDGHLERQAAVRAVGLPDVPVCLRKNARLMGGAMRLLLICVAALAATGCMTMPADELFLVAPDDDFHLEKRTRFVGHPGNDVSYHSIEVWAVNRSRRTYCVTRVIGTTGREGTYAVAPGVSERLWNYGANSFDDGWLIRRMTGTGC